MNIYEKISAIMADVKYMAKDDTVEFNTTKYRALSEEKVTSIMRAELLKKREPRYRQNPTHLSLMCKAWPTTAHGLADYPCGWANKKAAGGLLVLRR